MDRIEKGKLIVSVAKALKSFQIADPRIAAYLYGTAEAGRLGLFASSIRAEVSCEIDRIRFLAAQEGIGLHSLITEILPWLESAGLCQLQRDQSGNIQQFTSVVLAYRDLLGAVSDYHDSRGPSKEDLGCLRILEQASELPTPESSILQVVASTIGEEAAHTALQLAKAFGGNVSISVNNQ